MELQDGDFDDSAFPAFLAGYPASAVTDYADDTASALVGGGATPGDSSTCTVESSIMNSKFRTLVSKPAALAALALGGAAQAATDTEPIVAAGTDIAAVLAVIFGVMVAVWAAKLIQRKTVGS